MTKQVLSRRTFLGAVAAQAIVVVAGCSSDDSKSSSASSTGPSPEGSSSASAASVAAANGSVPNPSQYKESPMLTALVEAGTLPPIDQRLPKEPLVIRAGALVDDSFINMKPGKFGGTMQLAQELPTWDAVIYLGNVEPLLYAPNYWGYADGEPLAGNVVEGYEANADNTVFTFHLRDGIHWSDGHPVTMDDVRFAFDDVLMNTRITPLFPNFFKAGLQPGRAPATLTVVDELTFSLTFDAPYGAFPAQMAGTNRSYSCIIKPRHYLEQFHEKYADKATLTGLVKAASLPDDQWFNLFNAKQHKEYVIVSNEQTLGHPTLTAWTMTQSKDGVFQYERNPYYFKVDTEGNQLPYIDKLRAQLVQDKETLTSRALFGEFDYLGERASLRQLSLIADKADAGEVTLSVSRMHRLPLTFLLNLTYPDDVWRQVTSDVRFRRALSLAINRDDMVRTFFLGEFGSPSSETNAATYDVAEANRLLDEMGLDRKDGEGFRLGPDGNRFEIPFEIADLSEDSIPMAELLAEFWRAVGVSTTVRPLAQNVWQVRLPENQLKASACFMHHDIWGTGFTDDYMPTNWAPLWSQWYKTGGTEGEEPPAEVNQLFDLRGQFFSTSPGSAEGKDALQGVLASFRENLWVFNPVESIYYPTFWTTRVKNVPSGVKQEVFGIVVNIGMEQWYIEE